MTGSIQAIAGATALLGRELTASVDAVVVIEDGKIAAAGPSATVTIPEGAQIFDAPGKTLMPGFIDAHVHIGFYAPRDVLAGGVTTVRDLGWPVDAIRVLVEDSRHDGFEGPTIIAAGPMLTAPGGYPTQAAWAPEGTGVEISSPEHAAEVVAELAEAGSCIIKAALNPPVGPVLDARTLAAIVDAAQDHGLGVTAHIYGLAELDKAIEAGVGELAHMLMSDEAIPAATIQRMVEADMMVVPTLSCFSGRSLTTATENLAAFLNAGGRVVYGTDLGNEGPLPGIDPNEVSAMAGAGMSGSDIISSATVNSARWLGLAAKGIIAEGFDADLVLIDGDPSVDVAALTSVTAVWRRGRRVEANS